MLLLVIIARLYGIEGVAEFGLANSIVVPVVMFSSLRLRTILATDARKEFGFHDYVYLRVCLLIASSVALISALWIIDADKIVFELLVLILMAKIADSLSELYHGHLQLNETMGAAAVSCAAKMLLSVGLFYFGLRNSGDLVLSYALVVMVALFMLGFDAFYVIVKKRLVESKLIAPLNRAKLKKLAVISLPIGVVAFINSTTANIPIYAGGFMLDEFELGWLIILNLMLAIGVRFFTSLANVIATRVSKLYAEDLFPEIGSLIYRSHMFIVGLTAVLLVVWFFANDILLELLFGEWGDFVVFCSYIIIIASGFNHASLLGRFLLISLRRSGALMKIYAADFVTTLALATLLMFFYGIYGAVFAILIARIVRFLLTCKFSAGLVEAKN